MPLIQTLFILYLRMFVFDQTFIRHRDSDIQNQSPHWKLSTASASEPSSIKLISSYFAHLEINWVTVIIKSGSLNYPCVFYLKQDFSRCFFTWRIIPAVPTRTATVKIQRNRRSRTMATYFQSSRIWRERDNAIIRITFLSIHCCTTSLCGPFSGIFVTKELLRRSNCQRALFYLILYPQVYYDYTGSALWG